MISNTTVKKRWKKVENTLQGRFSNKFMLSGGEIVNYGKWVISFAFALSLQSCLQTAVASSSSNPADIFSAIAFVILFICDSFRMYIPMLFCSGIIPTDPNFADRRIPKSVFYRFTSILFLSLCLFYYAASNHSSWLGYFIAIGAVQVIDLLWYLPIKSPLKTIHQTESAIQRRIKASHTWSVFLSKINFAIFAIKALFSRDKLEDIVAHKNHDITKRHQLLEEEAAKARANVESSLKWYLDRYESISNETNQIIASIKKDREYARIAGWDIVFCGFIVIVYLFGDSGLLITNYALVAGVSLHIYNIISDYCINSGEYVQMIRFAFAKEPNFSATTTTPHKKIDHTESIRSYGFHSSLLKNANNLIERNSSEKMSLFFSFTGNAISAETREIITELCRKNCVSGICTTGAGIEEDIIKCRYDFRELSSIPTLNRKTTPNQIGEMYVPEDAYKYLEECFNKHIEAVGIQKVCNQSPGEFAIDLAESFCDESSYLYWCKRHNIPVFVPTLHDGALGDCFRKARENRKAINFDFTIENLKAKELINEHEKRFALILGGGTSKHFLLNASASVGGFNSALLITTALPFDGSDSGGSFEEAASWGKLAPNSHNVRIFGDFSVYLPLIADKLISCYGVHVK